MTQNLQMVVLYGYITLFDSFVLDLYYNFFMSYQETALVPFKCQI